MRKQITELKKGKDKKHTCLVKIKQWKYILCNNDVLLTGKFNSMCTELLSIYSFI